MSLSERDKRVQEAASWGVIDALVGDKTFGACVRARKLVPRTLQGDVYESSFLWARNEREFYWEAKTRLNNE